MTGDLLGQGEASLSEAARQALGAKPGDTIVVSHARPVQSLSQLRSKIYGERLDDAAMRAIIGDVASRYYSDLQLAAFITACAGERLDVDETIALTRAMVDVGMGLVWPRSPVMDKHSVGGLPDAQAPTPTWHSPFGREQNACTRSSASSGHSPSPCRLPCWPPGSPLPCSFALAACSAAAENSWNATGKPQARAAGHRGAPPG